MQTRNFCVHFGGYHIHIWYLWFITSSFFRVCGNENSSKRLIKSSHKDMNIPTHSLVLAVVVVITWSFYVWPPSCHVLALVGRLMARIKGVRKVLVSRRKASILEGFFSIPDYFAYYWKCFYNLKEDQLFQNYFTSSVLH